jgi:hypothetical protein
MRNAAGVLQRVLFSPSLRLPSTTSVLGTAAAAVATTSARAYASTAALVLNEFGVPENVLKLANVEIPSPESLGENEVLINIMAVRRCFFLPSSLTMYSYKLEVLSKRLFPYRPPLILQILIQSKASTLSHPSSRPLLAMKASASLRPSAQKSPVYALETAVSPLNIVKVPGELMECSKTGIGIEFPRTCQLQRLRPW